MFSCQSCSANYKYLRSIQGPGGREREGSNLYVEMLSLNIIYDKVNCSKSPVACLGLTSDDEETESISIMKGDGMGSISLSRKNASFPQLGYY